MSRRDSHHHSSKYSRSETERHQHDSRYRERSRSPPPEEEDDDDRPQRRAEPVRAKQPILFGNRSKPMGIQMKLQAPSAPQQAVPKSSKPVVATKPKSSLVAAAFNEDSDSEPEEMPPEARMRMKNIGRDTPTSSGPNSFGKTKQGFCDPSKLYEMSVKKLQQEGGKS